jgi:hypothetical protein
MAKRMRVDSTFRTMGETARQKSAQARCRIVGFWAVRGRKRRNFRKNRKYLVGCPTTLSSIFFSMLLKLWSLSGSLAEREGFEPPIPLRVCLISSQVHSTGLCHLSVGWWMRASPVEDSASLLRRRESRKDMSREGRFPYGFVPIPATSSLGKLGNSLPAQDQHRTQATHRRGWRSVSAQLRTSPLPEIPEVHYFSCK